MGHKKGTGMSVKDKLQIILITYNRAKHVESTFKQILSETSPIKDFNILVLDNNSTDNTSDIVRHWQKQFSNLQYQKNNYNIGISGNIAKAMEIANQKYLWIIADDDKYDFSNWNEVEFAIENNESLICVANYAFKEKTYTNIECQIGQMTFIPAIIYNTSLFNDTVIRNAFDNIFTLFPHLMPVINFINKGGSIYVTPKAIVDNNMQPGTDCSYVRGVNQSEMTVRSAKMSWTLGFCEIMSLLKDKKIRSKTIMLNIKKIYGDLNKFYEDIISRYSNNINLLFDILTQVKGLPRYKILFKLLFHKVYSKKKSDTHKIYTIFGIKFKVKRKGLKKVCYWLDSNQAGIIPMRDNHIYACCTRAVPILVDKKYYYDELTYDDIQKNRIKLYKDINSGKAPQCEGCDCLIKKPAKKIDIGKISYLIYHPHTTCNLQCCYCFFQKNEQYAKLDPRTADLYAAVKNFHKIGLFKENIQLELGGGEPLLLNNIDKTYEFMAENYPKGGIVLVSNYALSKRVDTIIPVFKQRKIKTVLKTSIDCGTRETYAKIRNRDVFEDVVNNITRSAKEGIFDAIYLKYILLEDGSNTSDKDIYGFIDICRQVAAQNPYKTSVIIDADMRAISEDGNEYFKTKEGEFTTFKPHLIKDDMLRAAGMIYKAVTDDLGLDVIWTGDRLSAVSKEGLEDIERIKEYANNIKDKRD